MQIQKRLDDQALLAETKSKEIKDKQGKESGSKDTDEARGAGIVSFDSFMTDREWSKEFEKVGETSIGKTLDRSESGEKTTQKSDE